MVFIFLPRLDSPAMPPRQLSIFGHIQIARVRMTKVEPESSKIWLGLEVVLTLAV
jgi:hypothetical protein